MPGNVCPKFMAKIRGYQKPGTCMPTAEDKEKSKATMFANSLNNIGSHIGIEDVVEYAKANIVANSLNNIGSHTGIEDVVQYSKANIVANGLNNIGSHTGIEDVVESEEDLDDVALMAKLKEHAKHVVDGESNIGSPTAIEDVVDVRRFGKDAAVLPDAACRGYVRMLRLQDMSTEDVLWRLFDARYGTSDPGAAVRAPLPTQSVLRYIRGGGNNLVESDDVLHVSARRWFRERNCALLRSGGIPMAAPEFWFVPWEEGGMFMTESMVERYMESIPHQYVVPMSSSKRIRDELSTESRRVRSKAEERHL